MAEHEKHEIEKNEEELFFRGEYTKAEQRYIIRYGRFGAYFFDTLLEKDVDLNEALELMNEYNSTIGVNQSEHHAFDAMWHGVDPQGKAHDATCMCEECMPISDEHLAITQGSEPCPQCGGEGYITNDVLYKGIGGGEIYPCPLCNNPKAHGSELAMKGNQSLTLQTKRLKELQEKAEPSDPFEWLGEQQIPLPFSKVRQFEERVKYFIKEEYVPKAKLLERELTKYSEGKDHGKAIMQKKIVQQLRDEIKNMISYINECSRNDDFSWSLFRLDIENNWSNFIRDKIEGRKDE